MNKTAFETIENNERELYRYLGTLTLAEIAKLESLSLSELETEIKDEPNFGRRCLIAHIITERK